MKRIYLLFLVLFAIGIYSCDDGLIDSAEADALELDDANKPGKNAKNGNNGNNGNNVVLPFTDPGIFKSITEDQEYCGEPIECTLIAGQNIDAGTVTVYNDDTNLYVKVYSKAGFQDVEENIKMWIGLSPPDRRPPSGQFPYKVTEDGDTHIFEIPLSTLPEWDQCGKQYVIIVHADVLTEEGNSGSGETAYGGCDGVDGQPWWAYMDYETQCCEDEDMEAYAYKVANPEHSFCFTDDGFSQWGWTNDLLSFDYRMLYNPLPIPIFVDGNGCDESDAKEIGTVNVKVIPINNPDGSRDMYVTVDYKITDSDYKINEANLYIGTNKYPLVGGSPSVDPENFNYQNDGLNTSSFEFTQIDWPTLDSSESVFIIPHLKVTKD